MREGGTGSVEGVRARAPRAGAMIADCALYAGGKRLRGIELPEIGPALAQPEGFVWIGLVEPSEELMKQVQAELRLHDLAVEDMHRAHQRPKFEVYGESLFVVLHTVRLEGGRPHFGETHVVVGPRYVVSVRHGASDSYAPVRERLEAHPELLGRGPGYVLYAILDFVVDHYAPVVTALEDEVASIEDQIFRAANKRRTAQRLYQLRRDLTALRRAVHPLIDVCNQLGRFAGELVAEEARPYYRDVHDHVVRLDNAIEDMREILTTALQVNLSLLAIGQNEVVKKLAGWAAILAVPTLVASVYGMNFRYMPELQWEFGYPAVVGLTALVCVLLYRRLKRAEWL